MDDGSQMPAPPAWLKGPAEPAGRAKAMLLLKGLLSVLLLSFLMGKVDWLAMEVRLIAAKPLPLVGALTLLVAAVFVAAVRWRLLVTRTGAQMSLPQAFQLTFAGLFFGQVLPATVGGDVVRGVLACRDGLAWRDVLSGIVLDRVTALVASMVLILCGLPWLLKLAAGTSLLFAALGSIALVGVFALGLCIDFLPLPRRLVRIRLVAVLLPLIKGVRGGLLSQAGLMALVLSVLIHLSTVAVVWLIATGLGVGLMPLATFVVVPVAILASAVPISLNGWGVREGVMVAGLSLFGVASGDALLVSILLGFGVILSVMPGSITWLGVR